MPPLKDLTGQKFGMLTVIKRDKDKILPSGQHKTMWLCQCDCGNKELVSVCSYDLRHGHTQSCGCLWKRSMSYNKEYKFYKDYVVCEVENGTSFTIDIADYDLISKYNWYSRGKGWFCGELNIYMHRFIMSPNDNSDVDHIDRNPNNNRRHNLRICSHQNNMMNQSLRKDNTSGISGVNWKKDRNKWHAVITINKKKINLGYYISKEDAIKARLKGEKEYFGEFAPQKHLFNQYNI